MLTDSLRLYVISEHWQLESDVGTKDLLTQMPSGSWYEFNLLIAQQTAAKKKQDCYARYVLLGSLLAHRGHG